MDEFTDGFLFVGNNPILDLLNTRLVVDNQPQEFLSDTSALLRWVRIAGLLPTPEIKSQLTAWSSKPEATKFLRELLTFRESLRDAVIALEEGKQPSKAFLANLNERLYEHPVRKAVAPAAGKLHSSQVAGTSIADTLWAAVLNETEQLLTNTDATRVRKCESCVVHFLDISKKNARRWCSMRLCGNKIKVATYQNRHRQASN
jgi:predicted RNA-binding Zn ribbon-like protein